MKDKRIVFLGTPAIAATVLEGLINEKYNIVAVVSQPDKEVGRKRILTPTAVKGVAVKYNIPVFQPASLKNDYQFLLDLNADILITTAYGQMIPSVVLAATKINNINVHGSLLPAYRGGAPIQRSIMNGDAYTGVCIMQMVQKMDAGCVYATKKIKITDDTTSSSLFEQMGIEGRDLLLKVLPDIIEKKLEGIPQDESLVSYAYNIQREEEKIDFGKTCKEVHNKINGLADNPGAYGLLFDKKIKIYRCAYSQLNDNKEVGTLRIENKNHLYVKCSDGYLELVVIQLEGKGKVQAKDFLNGANKDNLLKEKIM